MKRVTGIGGIFFKSDNPEKLKDWYKDRLGLETTEYGSTFYWHPLGSPDLKARTEWSVFKNDTKYFEPSKKDFMMNFRVHNLKELMVLLKEEGVQVAGEIEEYDYGKFGWVIDPDGNKIELWEPVDDVLNQHDEIK